MKIFTFNYKAILMFLLLTGIHFFALGQKDSSFKKRIYKDTVKQNLNMDAVYNRPFLTVGKLPIAIGGYLETNAQYSSTDGISDGFSFQMRRLTLFFSSTITKKIKFLSELEFEDGTKEINLEFAALDIEFHPLLNLRGGIIMNPIGAFNQNHDGPRWDFIDRPISATSIIPSTLSNAGFGIYGKYFSRPIIIGYEVYLSNGFDDNIISNSDNRTSLAAGKINPERFEESNNGLPMLTSKIAFRNRNIGELGISLMTGIYNTFQKDGLTLDSKRRMTAIAVDFNTQLLKNRINIVGEAVQVLVDVPETYSQTFGTKQWGGFMDIAATIFKRPMLGWEKSKINAVLRLEYADYNQGTFKETNTKIHDDIVSFVPGIAFRPAGSAVVRFNYRWEQQTDLLGNPPANTGVIQFGFSSYF